MKRQHPNKAWKEEKCLEIRTFQAEERAWANALESRHELGALGSCERSVWLDGGGRGVTGGLR